MFLIFEEIQNKEIIALNLPRVKELKFKFKEEMALVGMYIYYESETKWSQYYEFTMEEFEDVVMPQLRGYNVR